jgi:hypothetical protein
MKTIILGIALLITFISLNFLDHSKKPSEYVIEGIKDNTSRNLATSEIVFNYSYQGKPLKLTFRNTSWEDALKHGANKCIDYYTDGKRAAVGEDIFLDLIDVCVNPREKKG